MADHVVNGTAEAPSAMATPAASGNVQLMRSPAGEELQMQPAEEERVQMMPEEEIQAKGDEELQMQPEEEVQMQPEEELQAKEEEEVQMKASSAGAPAVQRSADGGKTASPQASSSIKATKGQGSRLPGPVNAEMSRKIGADFSDVKVHTDSRAAQLSADLGAQAFATGKDIYFAKGRYNPGSRDGKHLLAHELTHVVQQAERTGRMPLVQRQSNPGPAQSGPKKKSAMPPAPAGPVINPRTPLLYNLIGDLKNDINANIYTNAHHFLRIVNLYPENSQMMEEAFFRYGLGINVLQTTYGYLGADSGMADVLAYSTGITLKAVTFINDGAFTFDYQLPLSDRLNMEFSIDLYTMPDDRLQLQSLSTSLGVTGHF